MGMTGWWAEVHAGFGLALSPSLEFSAGDVKHLAPFGVTLQPEIGMGAAGSAGVSDAAFGLALTPQIGMAAAPVGKATFGLLVSPTLGMAGLLPPVEFDAVGPTHPENNNNGSWEHGGPAGAYAIVDIAFSGNETVTVTYGGVEMTQTAVVDCNDDPGRGRLFRFELADIPGGTQTVAYTKSGFGWIRGNSVTLTGVGSAATPETVFGGGTHLSHGPVVCPQGGMILQSFVNASGGSGGTAFTDLSGGINRFEYDGANDAALAISTSDATATFTADVASAWPWAGIATVFSPVN